MFEELKEFFSLKNKNSTKIQFNNKKNLHKKK